MLPTSLRTALDLKKAIELAAKYLKPIGVCETKQDNFKEDYGFERHEETDDEDDNDEGTQNGSARNKALFKELAEIYNNDGRDHWIGILAEPFRLTITRPGCEFSGDIVPSPDESSAGTNNKGEKPKVTSRSSLTKQLKKWFENGAVSGFGDVRAQETKVDANVRDAREIPASEFSISPNLIEQVEKCWGDHFVPGSVRVEPYKIHMYGPGGKFKAHRDTPEMNLVGTFLVGLGDTTKKGCLFIGNDIYGTDEDDGHEATRGSWIAFHPDVQHKVAEIESGYRAVIAFKLFRKEIEEGRQTSVVRKKMEKVLEKMQAPYGVLLAHEYCIGTTMLCGLDNILNEAAHAIAQKKKLNIHFLPVLAKVTAEAYRTGDMEEVNADAKVYPFTQAHVESLLKEVERKATARYQFEKEFPGDKDENEQDSGSNLVEIKWLVNAVDIPFYSVDYDKAAVTWTRIEEEGAEYTGNDAKPYTEDSIYFSYGMIVLPHVRGKKRALDEGGNSDASGSSRKRS
ncbi:hypothetical protein SCP_1000220 [Sparassis crispa]|uniref:Prolyl 4-hydroxylase alpha subunit Fe(2+) 2OG dioxygenase domain-containing protein n=1 Tax=Sparassis crispa TaxID=139825 RepID=A0A401GX70_9APHY|nr:hypothetical protein SCP_1000220 [Sparassis crispa]GBE86780.1 hypothetical protein SCP_1000220 [Sparassis crispa]